MTAQEMESAVDMDELHKEMYSEPDTMLEELWEIKRQIYEEIKDMTPEELSQYNREAIEWYDQWRAAHKSQPAS
jgi:hypothetical protein